jgi:hypothetical protein
MFHYCLNITETPDGSPAFGLLTEEQSSKLVKHQSYYDLSLASLQGIYSYVTLMKEIEGPDLLARVLHSVTLTALDENASTSDDYYSATKYPLSFASWIYPTNQLKVFGYSELNSNIPLIIVWRKGRISKAIEIETQNLPDYLSGFLLADRLFTRSISINIFELVGVKELEEPLHFSLLQNFALDDLPSEIILEISKYYPRDWITVSKAFSKGLSDIVLTDPRINPVSCAVMLLSSEVVTPSNIRKVSNAVRSRMDVEELKFLLPYLKRDMQTLMREITNRVLKLGDLSRFVEDAKLFSVYVTFVIRNFGNHLDPTKIHDLEIQTYMMIYGRIPLVTDKLQLSKIADEDIIALSRTILKDENIDKLAYIAQVSDLLAAALDLSAEMFDYVRSRRLLYEKTYRDQHLRFARWILTNINLFPDGSHINKIVVIFRNSKTIAGDESITRNIVELTINSSFVTEETLRKLERAILENVEAGYLIDFETEMLVKIRNHKLYKYIEPKRRTTPVLE